MMATIKSLSEISDIFVTLVLASVDCIFKQAQLSLVLAVMSGFWLGPAHLRCCVLRLWVAFPSLVSQLDSSDPMWVDKVGTAHNFWGWQVQLHHFSPGDFNTMGKPWLLPWFLGVWLLGLWVQGQGVYFPEATAPERTPILGNIIWTKPEIANWRPYGWALLTGVSCLLITWPRVCPCFPQLPSSSLPTPALVSSSIQPALLFTSITHLAPKVIRVCSLRAKQCWAPPMVLGSVCGVVGGETCYHVFCAL